MDRLQKLWPFHHATPEPVGKLGSRIHALFDDVYWSGVQGGALAVLIAVAICFLIYWAFKMPQLRATVVVALLGVFLWYSQQKHTSSADQPTISQPDSIDPLKPKRRRLLGEDPLMSGQLSLGGPTAPCGLQVMCDLPAGQRLKNCGGKDGAGLCVFTSIEHAARWQNEKRLIGLQQAMKSEPGGGYPQKVDAMLDRHGNGIRRDEYVNIESNNPSLLRAALDSGRMPAVTYNGRDPHYRGTIAHMVNLVYLDDTKACILDNNFIGQNELVWMSKSEFLTRWIGGQQGWCVVLLGSPPAPVPHN